MSNPKGPLSGFRDLLAEQMIPRQKALDKVRRVYEKYGFLPLKTPALEKFETMSGKYGEEGDKLMYAFTDQGDRKVALRYDQTVPLARVVAQYGSELPMPYKRYVIGEVWRGERPQAGRYREFTQFDADIVGTSSPLADAEVLMMSADAMTALGATAVTRVNDRRILDALSKKAGAGDEKVSRSLISTIDKVDKIGVEEVVKKIRAAHSDAAAETVSSYLAINGTANEKLSQLEKLLGDFDDFKQGAKNIKEVFELLDGTGYGDEIVFDHTIARGLDYYTGLVFETVLKDAPELGSVCGGGRYDHLIKALGGPDLPAVGTSIGVDRLLDGLNQVGATQTVSTNTKALVVNFDEAEQVRYIGIAAVLRKAGVPAEVYYEIDKLAKQIKWADRMGVPYVVLAGPDEIAKGVVVLKDMKSGEQSEVNVDALAEALS